MLRLSDIRALQREADLGYYIKDELLKYPLRRQQCTMCSNDSYLLVILSHVNERHRNTLQLPTLIPLTVNLLYK